MVGGQVAAISEHKLAVQQAQRGAPAAVLPGRCVVAARRGACSGPRCSYRRPTCAAASNGRAALVDNCRGAPSAANHIVAAGPGTLQALAGFEGLAGAGWPPAATITGSTYASQHHTQRAVTAHLLMVCLRSRAAAAVHAKARSRAATQANAVRAILKVYRLDWIQSWKRTCTETETGTSTLRPVASTWRARFCPALGCSDTLKGSDCSAVGGGWGRA